MLELTAIIISVSLLAMIVETLREAQGATRAGA